jgi:hypothetical protein
MNIVSYEDFRRARNGEIPRKLKEIRQAMLNAEFFNVPFIERVTTCCPEGIYRVAFYAEDESLREDCVQLVIVYSKETDVIDEAKIIKATKKGYRLKTSQELPSVSNDEDVLFPKRFWTLIFEHIE